MHSNNAYIAFGKTRLFSLHRPSIRCYDALTILWKICDSWLERTPCFWSCNLIRSLTLFYKETTKIEDNYRDHLNAILALLDCVSRSTVMARAGVSRLAVRRLPVRPLTVVSQKCLHGSRSKVTRSYPSVISPDHFLFQINLQFSSNLIQNLWGYCFSWGDTGYYSTLLGNQFCSSLKLKYAITWKGLIGKRNGCNLGLVVLTACVGYCSCLILWVLFVVIRNTLHFQS